VLLEVDEVKGIRPPHQSWEWGLGPPTGGTQFRRKEELATQMAVPGLWGRGPAGAELCTANHHKKLGGAIHKL